MKRTAHVDVERELAVLERAAQAGLLDPSQREEAEKVFRRVLDLGVPMSMFDVLTQRGFVARADMDGLSPSDRPVAGRPSAGGTDQVMDGPEALQVATLAMKAGFLPPGDLGDLLKKEAQSSTPLSVLLTRDKGLLPACIETLRAVARGGEGTPLSASDLELLGRIVAAGGSPLKAQAALSAVHILWRDARFSLSLPDALFKKEVIEPETLDDVMSGMGFREGKLAGYRGKISSEDMAEDRLRRVEEIRRIADRAGVALAVDEVLFLLGEVPSTRAPTAGRKRRARATPEDLQARQSRSRAAGIGLGAATLLAGGLLVFVALKLLGAAPDSEGPEVVTPAPRAETVEIPGAEDSARENVEWRFAQAEKFARKTPTRTAAILQRYRFLELKYEGTADGDAARQGIEAFLSRREKEASDEARTRIERSRSLASAGDFEEARIALSSFPKHLEGTLAEASIGEALEEMDRMEEALALESQREERARRDAREREAAIVRARNEEARRAKAERKRTADAIGMAQGLVMNFSYEEAIRSLEKYRDRSRSQWAAAECQKALDRAQAQKATFDSLLDLLGRGGEMPEVEFASGSKLRVTAADGKGVSAGNEQMTLKKPWHRIVAADFASILEWAGAGWTDPYEIATFSYDHGAPEWGDEVLRGVAEGDADGVSAWLARRRGVEVPRGGFVHYQGEWIPKIEAEHLALGEVLFQGRWWPRDELQAELKTARRDRDKKRIRKKAMEEAAAVAKILLDKEGIAAIEKMVENGDISRRVDISIVSDGFTQEEAGTVKRLADLVIKGIQKADPFRNYEQYINFNLVRLVEEESGINELPDKPRTTKVGATLQNNILTCDVAAAWKYGRKAPDCDLVIVVANVAGGRATGGGGVITLNNSGSVGDVVIHELGHAYGGLDDEYVDAGIAPGRNYGPNGEAGHINTTRESNPKLVKWHYWNFPPSGGSPVGCFEGAYYHDKDYYRPSRDCRMRSSGNPKYCAVCQEQMERRFYDQLEPLEGAWPARREVIIWADQKLRLEIEAITIKIEKGEKPYGKFTNNWYVDGVRTNDDVSYEKPAPNNRRLSRNYLDIQPDSLAPGRHEVIVNVDFKNDRIRRDHGNLSSTRVWSIVVSPFPEPEIAAPAKVRGKYRRPIAFQVKKKNVPAGGPFRFEARRLPRGATFNPESGFFRWIPDRYQKGLFRIEFVIDDGALSVSRFTDLQVRGGARNSGPVLKYLLPP
ncbi:MAG: M64 family metallo-endopeptidase, partial [Planctomycetota bacterium]|nr:M64 family metallo-endopeptidase [Planctomycetota bacterium]